MSSPYKRILTPSGSYNFTLMLLLPWGGGGTNLGAVFLQHPQLDLGGAPDMANLPPPSPLPFGQVSEPITGHQQLKNKIHETLINKGVTFTFYM